MQNNIPIKRSPLKLILLVFILSIPFWLADNFVPRLPLPIKLPVSALQFIVTLVLTCIFVYREESFAGIIRLFKRVFDVRGIKNKIWYLPIFLLNPLIMLLSYGILYLLGRPLPAEPLIPWLEIPIFFVIFFLAAACEEVCWTGYVIDPLQERWGALAASAFLGIVWALWHILPWLSIQPPLWVAGQALSSIVSRIVIVWLYNNIGKSLIVAILFHDMKNVSEFAFPNYGSHYDPVVSSLITTVIALLVVGLWGPATLARLRFRSQAK
ncbi:CPBP family intramembrane metalloprotease [Ktedonosporobacter rubrisoli]|uniref:CPBP family intramembrane metalloprotease n=1 Tax=Ktedonosporobacter rubrisoli TaxID=2509675 RepID=A0A4P6JL21_KTERU|nr:CPBP family intramembrane glutamic endopeptidase [Ktedonosporobacter rubrisoli]QBD75888.1 CPBP family intramembrane metalloprotease [Ktedonosporobacter rubrisoli]